MCGVSRLLTALCLTVTLWWPGSKPHVAISQVLTAGVSLLLSVSLSFLPFSSFYSLGRKLSGGTQNAQKGPIPWETLNNLFWGMFLTPQIPTMLGFSGLYLKSALLEEKVWPCWLRNPSEGNYLVNVFNCDRDIECEEESKFFISKFSPLFCSFPTILSRKSLAVFWHHHKHIVLLY